MIIESVVGLWSQVTSAPDKLLGFLRSSALENYCLLKFLIYQFSMVLSTMRRAKSTIALSTADSSVDT